MSTRVKRLGEIMNAMIPDTVDEAEFDSICDAIGHSTIPDAMSAIVFAVTGRCTDEDES